MMRMHGPIAIDQQDVWLLTARVWSRKPRGYMMSSVRRSEDAAVRVMRRYVHLHRMILDAGNEWHVDHISGDVLDCRRQNLRLCTASQNMYNTRPRVNNTTGLRGVSQDKGKYRAEIKAGKVRYWLGYFATLAEAAQVYDAAAAALHGEFARLNFPQECVA